MGWRTHGMYDLVTSIRHSANICRGNPDGDNRVERQLKVVLEDHLLNVRGQRGLRDS